MVKPLFSNLNNESLFFRCSKIYRLYGSQLKANVRLFLLLFYTSKETIIKVENEYDNEDKDKNRCDYSLEAPWRGVSN